MYFYTTRRKIFDIVAEATLVALFVRMYAAYAPVLPTLVMGALALAQMGVLVYRKKAYARTSLYGMRLYDLLVWDLAVCMKGTHKLCRYESPTHDVILEVERTHGSRLSPRYIVTLYHYLGDEHTPSSATEWCVARKFPTGYIPRHHCYFDGGGQEQWRVYSLLERLQLPRDELYVGSADIEAVRKALKTWDSVSC